MTNESNTKTVKASKLRSGMTFRKTDPFGGPWRGEWRKCTRIDQARARGYLIAQVEGAPWVSLVTSETIEVQTL